MINNPFYRKNSDPEIRKLERALKSRGYDVMAAAALLRARLRAGLLSQERLNMAVRLGDEAARLAGGVGELLNWASILDRREVLVLLSHKKMAVLACKWAESVLPIWESRYPNFLHPRIAIEATRRWINNPTPELAQAAYQAAANSVEAATGLLGTPEWDAARAAADAARVPSSLLHDKVFYISSATWNTAIAAGDVASANGRGNINLIYESQRLDVIQALLTPDEPLEREFAYKSNPFYRKNSERAFRNNPCIDERILKPPFYRKNSDSGKRSLERAWRDSKSLVDLQAWLRAMIREEDTSRFKKYQMERIVKISDATESNFLDSIVWLGLADEQEIANWENEIRLLGRAEETNRLRNIVGRSRCEVYELGERSPTYGRLDLDTNMMRRLRLPLSVRAPKQGRIFDNNGQLRLPLNEYNTYIFELWRINRTENEVGIHLIRESDGSEIYHGLYTIPQRMVINGICNNGCVYTCLRHIDYEITRYDDFFDEDYDDYGGFRDLNGFMYEIVEDGVSIDQLSQFNIEG